MSGLMETLSAIYKSKQADVYLLKALTLFLHLLTKWMLQLFELNMNGMGSLQSGGAFPYRKVS